MTWPRMDGLRTLELGAPGRLRRELTALVLAGPKRATAGLLSDYGREGEALETAGELLVLVADGNDAAGIPVRAGLLRVTAVDVVPFAEVSDDFARAEGEGYAGHADWALAHRGYWQAAGARIDDATPVVCIRFILLEPATHPWS